MTDQSNRKKPRVTSLVKHPVTRLREATRGVGDHGVAVMSVRKGLGSAARIESNGAALRTLVTAMVAVVPEIDCLRDPTRGGLTTTLDQLARQSGVGVPSEEETIPVRPEVSAACKLLGFDPLCVANEGKLVAMCPAQQADRLLKAMRAHRLGAIASRIGTVLVDPNHFVQMNTSFRGLRVVDWLTGEQLPRIC